MVSQDNVDEQAAESTGLVVQLGQRPHRVVPAPREERGQVLGHADAADGITRGGRPAHDGVVGVLGELVRGGREQGAAQLTQVWEAQQTHLADEPDAMAMYRDSDNREEWKAQ